MTTKKENLTDKKSIPCLHTHLLSFFYKNSIIKSSRILTKKKGIIFVETGCFKKRRSQDQVNGPLSHSTNRLLFKVTEIDRPDLRPTGYFSLGFPSLDEE